MSSFLDGSGLEDLPHFRSEWRRQEGYLQHLHSPDMAVIVALRGVPMREVDLLSSREAYSFPFCPRVYKFVLGSNYISEAQLSFDVRLLLEHVPKRVSNQSSKDVNEWLSNRLSDLLRCLEYLHQRFGPFRISKQMIGWTELGVVKAWINPDFSVNHPLHLATAQQEMIADLFAVLDGSCLLDHLWQRQFSTFRQLRQHIQKFPRERASLPRKEALRPIDNLSRCAQSETDRLDSFLPSTPDYKVTASRKNITFSYSNKNLSINQELLKLECNSNRNSMAHIEDLKNNVLSKALTLRKEFTFGNNCNQPDQTASMKVIYPQRRTDKKYSFHHPPTIDSFAQLKTNHKPADPFYKFKPADRVESRKMDIYRLPIGKEKLLHYSTSTNPYSKFINKKAAEDKSISSLDRHNDSIPDEAAGKENRMDKCGQSEAINEMYDSMEEKEERRAAQEVKEDLDALFDSHSNFDEKELTSQLESMFL